ncbi:MAG TPA: hypothetical protein VIY48_07925 [Candidatus Paceibacterota bacterium]
MLSPSQALQKASKTTRWAVGMCDNFVANMFGYSASGYPTAANHWNSIPSNDKHPGDYSAPAGALMFWGGGAGHVAISDGNGGIFSTDYPSAGQVSHVSASVIAETWKKPYLGWSVPVFQGQVGTVSQAGLGTADVSSPGDIGKAIGGSIPGLPSVGTSFINSLLSGFETDLKDLLERLGLMVLGFILIVVGLLQFTRTQQRVQNLVGTQVETAKKERVDREKTAEQERKRAVRSQEQRGRNVQRRKQEQRGSQSETHQQTQSNATNTSAERRGTRLETEPSGTTEATA